MAGDVSPVAMFFHLRAEHGNLCRQGQGQEIFQSLLLEFLIAFEAFLLFNTKSASGSERHG